MKTWFDFMDEYYEPSVSEISDLQQNANLKKRVMEKLEERANGAPKKIKLSCGLRRWAMVAAAVALACCVGVGAMAATTFPWDSVFGKYFGDGAQSQATELGMSGEGMQLISSDSGYTLTLNGALFDGEKLYLPITIDFENENPDPNLLYYVWPELDKGAGGGSRVLQDMDPDDQKVDVMCTFSGSEIQSGETITVNILMLYANRSDEQGNTENVWQKEGTWSFTFTVPQAKQVHKMKVITGAKEPVTGTPVAQIRLTPMRVSVIFEGLPQDSSVRDTLSRAEIVLHLADGSTRVLGNWEEGLREAQGSIDEATSPIGRAYYEVSCEYGDFIDPAEIMTVDINGCSVANF